MIVSARCERAGRLRRLCLASAVGLLLAAQAWAQEPLPARDYVPVALAKLIASKSSYTLKVGKEAFYAQAEMGLSAAYSYASEVMTENMMARDAEEGICAFIEKRKPTWEDR